jgi:uncharacterized protein YjbI with pentapeptide repeats
MDFSGSDFTDAELQDTQFTKAILLGVKFDGAQLNGVTFEGARIEGASFTHAGLTNVTLKGAALKAVSFQGVSFAGQDLSGAKFDGCHFDQAQFSAVSLQKATFVACSATGANFENADLHGARLAGSDFSGAIFKKAILDGADLSNAKFGSTDLRNANLGRTTVSNTEFAAAKYNKGTILPFDQKQADLLKMNFIKLFEFQGISKNIPMANLDGWSICSQTIYGNVDVSLDKIKADCKSDNVMLACRPKGSDTLTVAAYGRFDAVFRDIGDSSNTGTMENGVQFYYSTNASIGFAGADDTINRNTCDVGDTNPDNRLCFHTSGNVLRGGYRCGAMIRLNESQEYERLFLKSE